jgi:SAM-dependent methyltransferase
VAVHPEFQTAPRAYRPLLRAELRALEALKRAGVGFGDRRRDAPVGGPANHRRNQYLGHVAAERLVPGVYAPADDLVTHVNRYLWALPRVEGKRVLDVGCGAGYGSLLMSWTSASVIGVDLDPTAVAYARTHFPGVDYREADAGEDLDGEIDVATCFEVLEHVADPDAVLAGIARHSRRLLLSFPNPLAAGSHLNPHHVNDWPLAHLKRRLRAAGFTRWELFHQAPWSPVVRRGGRLWAAVWMLDVSSD